MKGLEVVVNSVDVVSGACAGALSGMGRGIAAMFVTPSQLRKYVTELPDFARSISSEIKENIFEGTMLATSEVAKILTHGAMCWGLYGAFQSGKSSELVYLALATNFASAVHELVRTTEPYRRHVLESDSTLIQTLRSYDVWG